jgi:hypothetical protein
MKATASTLERLVSQRLSALPSAETGRNSWGILWFKWASPCPEIEALWLSVTPREVVLSCKVGHSHFSRSTYHHEKLTNLRLKRRIAKEAVKEATRFLRSEIAVGTEVKDDASQGSSMWCRASQLSAALEHSRNVLGPAQHRAWVWSGAVAC